MKHVLRLNSPKILQCGTFLQDFVLLERKRSETYITTCPSFNYRKVPTLSSVFTNGRSCIIRLLNNNDKMAPSSTSKLKSSELIFRLHCLESLFNQP